MIRRAHPIAFAALALAALLAGATARGANPPATKPDDKLEFLRFTDDGKGGGTLDTAIATYRNADGVTVHLVAAVHVGEKFYYKDLAKVFDTYDALLYELVKPKEGLVPGDNRPAGEMRKGPQVRGAAAIGGLQGFLKNSLKLDFQLDAIDYTRPNFVHADLDVETFNQMQEDRGETIFGLMLRSILSEMTRKQTDDKNARPVTMIDILVAMRSPDSARQYKLLLARQFGELDAKLDGMEGNSGSVIISERNKIALKVLDQTIAKGKRSIGIFYGAGHMRGIEAELLTRRGFTRTAVEWRTAWDMRTPADAAPPKPK